MASTRSGHLARHWQLERSDDESWLNVRARAAVADRILESKHQKFEEALMKLHADLARPYCLKRYAKVLESVGHLRERYGRMANQYDIQVRKDPNGPNATQVTFARRESSATVGGGYVLRTSYKDWDLERIVRTYGQLTNIENTFRALKLGLRQISRDDRIEGHMFVSVLAYHGVQLIRTKLRKCKVNDDWGSLQTDLRNWQRVTTMVTDKAGDTLIHKQDCRPSNRQRELAQHLGVSCGRHLEQTRIPRAGTTTAGDT